MIVCLACYEDRLASLFENAASFRLFEVNAKGAEPLGELDAPQGDATALGAAMTARGAQTLVCGGISGASRRLLLQHGLTVQPWISGSVAEVLDALARGALAELAMPGVPCAGGGRGMGAGRGMGMGAGAGRGMGMGPGQGMGAGRAAGGRGMGGRGMGGGGMGGGGRKAAAVAAGPGLGLGPCGLGQRRGPAGRAELPAQGAPGTGPGLGAGRGMGQGLGAGRGMGAGMGPGLGRGGRRGR